MGRVEKMKHDTIKDTAMIAFIFILICIVFVSLIIVTRAIINTNNKKQKTEIKCNCSERIDALTEALDNVDICKKVKNLK